MDEIDGLEKSFNLDELIGTYTASSEPCVIVLPTGEELSFKTPENKASIDNHLRAAAHWYSKLPDLDSELAKTHNFAGVLPANAADAITAFSISEWSLNPKISQKQALKMLRAPWLVKNIMNQLEHHMKTLDSIVSLKLLEEAKKNSMILGGESE